MQIWRFYESKKNHDRVKSAPLPLFQLNENAFAFSQEESYLVLLIYKSGAESKYFTAHKEFDILIIS